MLARIVRYLKLPAEVSREERAHLATMTRIAKWFLAAHVPALMAVAALQHTSPLAAALLALLTLAGLAVAVQTLDNPRHVTRALAVAAMCMGALLVHFGHGPMQIEMHFYFFVLLALLAVFGDPAVILLAAVTVALHRLALYFFMPRSVFNYEASIGAVAVHALFVALESVAGCFVARTFFDRVIGLERIVTGRTRDLRLMLDSVDQGLFSVAPDGAVAPERSAVLDAWLGPCVEGERAWAYLARGDARAARRLEAGWQQLADGALPLELCLDQLPARMTVGARELELAYKPALTPDGSLAAVMVVLTDVSARVERERAEAENRDVLRVCEGILRDRAGFLAFVAEADGLVRGLEPSDGVSPEERRRLHTLKGGCALWGLDGLAALCHDLEDALDDRAACEARTRALIARWRSLHAKVERLFGAGDARVELADGDIDRLARAVSEGEARGALVRRIEALRLDPAAPRLERLADHARAVARDLGKGGLRVSVECDGLRLPREAWAPLWAALVHAVHNAVDHGVEAPDERASEGKPRAGQLWLRAARDGDATVVEVRDDGRGVDWERVRAGAVARGLPAKTHDDLVEALFSDGLTTKTEADGVSGRGVGMGALREACRRLGATLSVESEPGRGTRVVVRAPSREARTRRETRRSIPALGAPVSP